jgi:hypothetical protein
MQYEAPPEISSPFCRIKVESSSDNRIYGLNPGNFTITQIVINSPIANDFWAVGANRQISWSTAGFTENVNILLSTDGGNSFPTILASDVVNDGNEFVPIPDLQSSSCRIKIESTTNPSLYGISNGDFNIEQPFVKVKFPNGGEKLQIGTIINIKWEQSKTIAATEVFLSTNGGNTYTFLETVFTDSLSWNVQSVLSDNCKIALIGMATSTPTMVDVNDQSDSVFSIVSNSQISTKLFIEGSFANDSMSTYLNIHGYLTVNQPFNTIPWNYSGTESVASIPDNVVDWILLELRSNPNTIISRRAAFLKNDGTVVDMNGTSPVSFTGLNAGNYYLVVKHRNSIETWSATLQTFGTSTLGYDFTTSATQAYGSNMILKGTKWCIYSGDVNQDGQVSFTDLIAVDNDNSHYVNGNSLTDLNGDGQVTFSDLIIVDNNNLHYVSKVVPPGSTASKNVTNGL